MPDDPPNCCSLGQKANLEELVSDAYTLMVDLQNQASNYAALAAQAASDYATYDLLYQACLANLCAPQGASDGPCGDEDATYAPSAELVASTDKLKAALVKAKRAM